jgi:hypothetical protein
METFTPHQRANLDVARRVVEVFNHTRDPAELRHTHHVQVEAEFPLLGVCKFLWILG